MKILMYSIEWDLKATFMFVLTTHAGTWVPNSVLLRIEALVWFSAQILFLASLYPFTLLSSALSNWKFFSLLWHAFHDIFKEMDIPKGYWNPYLDYANSISVTC